MISKKMFRKLFDNILKIFKLKKYKNITIYMTNEEFIMIAMEAHKRDITFNEMFEIMINDFINEYKKNPEKWKNIFNK